MGKRRSVLFDVLQALVLLSVLVMLGFDQEWANYTPWLLCFVAALAAMESNWLGFFEVAFASLSAVGLARLATWPVVLISFLTVTNLLEALYVAGLLEFFVNVARKNSQARDRLR